MFRAMSLSNPGAFALLPRRPVHPSVCLVSAAICSAIHQIDCTHRWSLIPQFFQQYIVFISASTPVRSFPSLYLPNFLFIEKQNKPHEKQTKTKKRLIRTKCAPTNQPSKMKQKLSKNTTEFALCWLTTPAHGACPRVCSTGDNFLFSCRKLLG